MSFILESLQRAQKDRRKGKAPDLQQAYREDSPPPSRRRWPLLLASLLVLLIGTAAGGVFWWQKSRAPEIVAATQPERPAQKMTPPVAPVSATPESGSPPAPATGLSESTKKAATPPAPSQPPPTRAAATRTLTMAAAPAAPPPPPTAEIREPAAPAIPRPLTPQPAASAPPPLPGNEPEVQAPEAAEAAEAAEDVRPLVQEAKIPRPLPPPEVAPPPRPEPMVIEEEEFPEEAPDPEPQFTDDAADRVANEEIQAQTPPQPESREPEIDWSQIPLVSDLPAETRAALSELEINVHGYFQTPERRVVFINMQRYKVGDRIGEEKYLLEAITPEGVVINYGEGRARLAVRR